MFVKLRTARYLKARADASGVTVGYSGVAARIARVHQFGERDQVAPGIFTDYPVRELLGISQADERLIYNTVLGRIAELYGERRTHATAEQHHSHRDHL